MTPFEYILLALALFRLVRLITTDAILDEPREMFFNKFPPRRHYRSLGYLASCPWCLSIWIGAIFLLLNFYVPVPFHILRDILALSTVVGFLAQYDKG